MNIKELHQQKAAACLAAIRSHRATAAHPTICMECLELENDYDRHMAAIEDINVGIREYGLYKQYRG